MVKHALKEIETMKNPDYQTQKSHDPFHREESNADIIAQAQLDVSEAYFALGQIALAIQQIEATIDAIEPADPNKGHRESADLGKAIQLLDKQLKAYFDTIDLKQKLSIIELLTSIMVKQRNLYSLRDNFDSLISLTLDNALPDQKPPILEQIMSSTHKIQRKDIKAEILVGISAYSIKNCRTWRIEPFKWLRVPSRTLAHKLIKHKPTEK